MKKLVVLVTLCSSIAYADGAAITAEMGALRSVPDAQRGVRTGSIAREIAALPKDDPEKLPLAQKLASLATEGDAGRENLQAVTDTLSAAAASSTDDDTKSYVTLANLARYEGLRVPPAITKRAPYAAAMAQLAEIDRLVEKAEFTLKDASGTVWSKKGLRGKVVLLNFWATWCPPCRAELPSLEAIAAKHASVVVVAVTDEDEPKVSAFLKGSLPHVHVVFDAGHVTAQRYHVHSWPRTFVLGRDGKLVATAIDGRTEGQLDKMLGKAGVTP